LADPEWQSVIVRIYASSYSTEELDWVLRDVIQRMKDTADGEMPELDEENENAQGEDGGSQEESGSDTDEEEDYSEDSDLEPGDDGVESDGLSDDGDDDEARDNEDDDYDKGESGH
jgi:hypothetical protein